MFQKSIVRSSQENSAFGCFEKKIVAEAAQKTSNPPPMTPNKTAPPVARRLTESPAAPELPVWVLVGVALLLREDTREETLEMTEERDEERLLATEEITEEAEDNTEEAGESQ